MCSNSKVGRYGGLKVLAGLINAGGNYQRTNCFHFSQSALWHSRLFDDNVLLVRSLGCYCCVPKRVLVPGGLPGMEGRLFDIHIWFTSISGHICEVPCLLPRKQSRKRTKKRSHYNYPLEASLQLCWGQF